MVIFHSYVKLPEGNMHNDQVELGITIKFWMHMYIDNIHW